MVCIIMLCCLNVRNAIFASTDMVWRGMEQRILSIEIRAVSKAVDRYLGESMPLSAKETTGGNAHIIMFLARNRDREIYQHTIEQKFCITRSTASRVLALMEKILKIETATQTCASTKKKLWKESSSDWRLRKYIFLV